MALHLSETRPTYAVFLIHPQTGERAIHPRAIHESLHDLRAYARRNLRFWRIDWMNPRTQQWELYETQSRAPAEALRQP